MRRWSPWKSSTGPKSAKGKALVARMGEKAGSSENYAKLLK